MEPERRQQNVATASTKSVATMPPKRKTLNQNDLKGEILSRVKGRGKPLLQGRGLELNHLSPRELVGFATKSTP